MASLAEIEAALRNADAAGATEDARALAREYVRMKGGDVPAMITMPTEQQRLENAYKEIASKNSFAGNLLDGATNAAQRYMLGGKQMLGLATPADKAEFQAADKAFGGTAGGKIGDIAGTVAPAVAATFIPGGNTIVGQALIGGGMGMLQPADSGGQRALNTGLGAGFGALAKYGGDKLGNWLAERAAAKAAEMTTQNAVRDAAIGTSREAGYVIPPAFANPTVANRALEGFAGKISTAQGAAIKNQPVTDNLVRQALGMADDAPITRDALKAIRTEAGKLYDAAGQLGTITTDPAYVAAIDKVVAPLKTASTDFPGVVADDAVKLAEKMKVGQFDAGSAVEALKALREQATGNLGPMAKGTDKALGRVQKGIADALEAQIERHAAAAGEDGVVKAMQEARTLIAKSYSVEKALREGTGSVSAKGLAQQLAKGKPLSGELETIAKFAQNFPRAAQDVTSSMPGISPLDYSAGGLLSAVTGNPLLLGSIAARPAVRSAILSQPFQRAFVNAPNYGAGLLSRGTTAALEDPTTQMLLTSGLLGAATR